MEFIKENAYSTRIRIAALLLASFVPIAVAYFLMLRFAVNIPYLDDYPNFLGFGIHLRGLPSISEKLYYFLTVQHGEYKFVLMHIVALIEMSVTHKVDMRVLSVVGDLFLLALLPLLWNMYLPEKGSLESKLLFFLPIVFLVFGLNYAEGIIWPSSTLFYAPAIFFSFLAIHLLVRPAEGREWVQLGCACVAALIAYVTAPNTTIIFPIGVVFLLSRRAFAQVGIWCLVLMCGLAPYLVKYDTGDAQVVTQGHASLMEYTLFLLSFVGSAALKAPAPVVAGIAMLTLIVLAMRTGYARSHLSATLGIVWILASAALVAYGRAHAGFSFALTPRYRIYSDLLLVYCYASSMSWIARSSLTAPRQRLLRGAAIGMALLSCVANDAHAVTILRKHQEQLFTGLAHYQASNHQATPMYFPDAPTTRMFGPQEVEARSLMEEATRQGLYVPPVAPYFDIQH